MQSCCCPPSVQSYPAEMQRNPRLLRHRRHPIPLGPIQSLSTPSILSHPIPSHPIPCHRSTSGRPIQSPHSTAPYCAVLCCAVLCCAVLCCAVLCYAVLCCAVLCGTVPAQPGPVQARPSHPMPPRRFPIRSRRSIPIQRFDTITISHRPAVVTVTSRLASIRSTVPAGRSENGVRSEEGAKIRESWEIGRAKTCSSTPAMLSYWPASAQHSQCQSASAQCKCPAQVLVPVLGC